MRVLQSILYMSVTTTTLFLSGCLSLNSQFDCPMKPSVMCKSLDEVNSMVDQGKLGNESSSRPVASNVSEVTRIWIAPHEDKNGRYGPALVALHN